MCFLEDELQKLVAGATFSLIEKAMEAHSMMFSIEIDQAFIEGFSLAVSLLLDSLSKK